MNEFSFRIGEPGNEVPGGSNFIFLKVNDGFVKVLFEFVDHIDHLLSYVSGFGTGSHSIN